MRNFPGRVIDANLALDQKSPMEKIYQNNWLNADKTIKTIGRGNKLNPTKGNRSSGSSSSSGDVFSGAISGSSRDRNSISSLGKYQVTQEQMRQLDLAQTNTSLSSALSAANGYSPSTLRHRQRFDEWDDSEQLSNNSQYNGWHNCRNNQVDDHNSLDDLHRDHNNNTRLPKIKRSQTMHHVNSKSNIDATNLLESNNETETDDPTAFKTATISKNFNRSLRRNILNALREKKNCDTHTADENGQCRNHSRKPNSSLADEFNEARNVNIENHLSRSNGKVKPVTRAKSVRINPTPFIGTQYDAREARRSTESCNGGRVRPTSMNILSIDTKEMRPLPRLLSIMKKRPSPSPEAKQESPIRRSCSASSLSSIGSNLDEVALNKKTADFSIPRPRLIVPVHTYARKRRTGNLNQNAVHVHCNDDDRSVSKQLQHCDRSPHGKQQVNYYFGNDVSGPKLWVYSSSLLLFLLFVSFERIWNERRLSLVGNECKWIQRQSNALYKFRVLT